MEKMIQIPKHNNPVPTTRKLIDQKPSPLIWDCGSSLYDSFELNSFRKQLDSAIISGRTLSMPHLSSIDTRTDSMPHLSSSTDDSDRRLQPHRRRSSSSFSFDDPLPPLPPPKNNKNNNSKPTSSKLSRSVQKLLRSVFNRNKMNNYDSASTTSSTSNSATESPTYWDDDGNIVKRTSTRDGSKSEKKDSRREDRFFVVYDKSPALSTIPEGPEIAGFRLKSRP